MAWTATALWYQFGQARWLAVVLLLAGLGLIAGAAVKGRAMAWLTVLGLLVVVLLWWFSIKPMQDREWAPDVAYGVVAEFDGSQVTLRNVRDFHWITRDEAVQNWTQTTVDLEQLQSVDFISTTWSSPHIAHTMMSFGFADGQYVVFSAEIRREKHEKFSEIGGFFKQFELVLIGATEEDIVKLRTHARGEDVSIFPLSMTPEQKRALFLSYLALGNDLDAKPRWYQTITTNCTTVIWRLARHVHHSIPMDWRILLSGHAQDYLYDIGVVANDRPLAQIKQEAHITPKARALPDDADYSAGIRAR